MPHFTGTTKLSDLTCYEFKQLVEQIVDTALTRVMSDPSLTEFINSKACATLLGVTPEHLCAMRARGEGPSWSGEGKWVRYRRDHVVAWLTNLPRKAGLSRFGQDLVSTSAHERPP
jgi:hypothetical protein